MEIATKVRMAKQEERESVLQTITLAFSADPFVRWALTNSSEYLVKFPEMNDLFCVRQSINESTTYVTQELEGAAVWTVPRAEGYTEEHLKAWEAWVEANINSNIMDDFVNRYMHRVVSQRKRRSLRTSK